MQFYKYHALGNDYLVLNPDDFPEWAEQPKGEPTPEQIRAICHRHYGIGSDGILWGSLKTESGQLGLKIFNPDGSEAEKSGNGLRIFARYLAEHGLVSSDAFTIHTLGGPAAVQIIDRAAWRLRIGMGPVTFSSPQIPVSGPSREVLSEALDLGDGQHFTFSAASVGNPHCVIPLPEISETLARRYGPMIETHPLFPKRINVQFLKVLDRRNIQIEIWERGAGYTLASGSSSSAAAAVAHRLGLVGPHVTVHMPGGQLEVEIAPADWHITLTGTVTKVAEGRLSPDLFTFPHPA